MIIAPSYVIKGAKHPNAAKLLLEYLMRPQASEIALNSQQDTIHLGPAPKGGKARTDIKTLIAQPEALLKSVPELKGKWRDTFGI